MCATLFQKEVGILMYLIVGTRPDSAFDFGRLSKYKQHTTNSLWYPEKRVFRFLHRTSDIAVLFGGDASGYDATVGFSDSDCAG